MKKAMGLLLIVFSLSLYGGTQSSHGKILILNSDKSVEKYALVEKAFRADIDGEISTLDLGLKFIDYGKVAEEILVEDPDLIFCIGSKAYLLAHKFGGKRNIVFALALNWRRFELTDRTYGISHELNRLSELTMYRYLFPGLSSVGVVYGPKFSEEAVERMVEDGKAVGVKVVRLPITGHEELVTALTIVAGRTDALVLIPDPVALADKKSAITIFEKLDKARIPVFAYDRLFFKYGALLSISPDIPTVGRQAARLAKNVLSGKKIDMKIEYPAGSRISLDVNKTTEYGVELNSMALSSVNEIIR